MTQANMTLNDIDFADLYRQHMRDQCIRPKPARAWDGRAKDYGRSSGRSRYVEEFIAGMDLSDARTVLDVGCGPGTLALPLAQRLERVVALDYSASMLEQLNARAAAQGISNIQTVHRSWEDDWHDVPICDIAIASRSTTVDDIASALDKLDRHARQRVYLSYIVGGHFIDRQILACIGGAQPTTPDHLLLLGVLHQMGLQPTVDYIDTPSRLGGCASFDEFARRLAWSTGDFDDAARGRLHAWYDADPVRAQQGGAPMRWAFIGWTVRGAAGPGG